MSNDNLIDYDNISQEELEKIEVKNLKSRVFCGILYPDDENHKFAISCLVNNVYHSIAIHHDRDKKEDGSLKKVHTHFIIKFQNPRYLFSVAKELKIKNNYIQCCSSFSSYSKYIIHLDEPFKEQYLPSEAFGNLFNDFISCVSQVDGENDKVIKIIDYIYSSQIMSIKTLVLWVCKNGLYDTFRRNYSMFRDIKNEKDGKI